MAERRGVLGGAFDLVGKGVHSVQYTTRRVDGLPGAAPPRPSAVRPATSADDSKPHVATVMPPWSPARRQGRHPRARVVTRS